MCGAVAVWSPPRVSHGFKPIKKLANSGKFCCSPLVLKYSLPTFVSQESPHLVITVFCPHCGRPNTVRDRIRNGTQRETCRHCNKNFGVRFRDGELYDITR
ncbi:hypothetical protein Q31b_37630 [Novipirellula aureliae]|uniref:InsA N-terminal domain-containing protein n=1 Tax=Novipirellula aureliae TaxID=2527966 RepID=A0A5C6DR44_9BACT|nr:hypothetical protein Q31b_37630 [Novipirellula aureliae]